MVESTFNEPSAARILGISARTLAEWRKRGAIGFHRTPGGRIFYTTDQISNCRAKMRVEPGDL
jgi:predicted site-specific integrase-resolvase